MTRDLQYEVAKLLLSKLHESGFVLAGGRALVELKLTNRPTKDLDLFTKMIDSVNFEGEVERAIDILVTNGFSVSKEINTSTFARLNVSDENDNLIVELGYDYREYNPTVLEIGSVLDERDAILNKISALYARSIPRDFIDAFYIRLSGRMSDAEILALSKERDEGFVLEYFVDALRRVKTFSFEEFSEYNISREQFTKIVESTLDWANNIASD